MEKNILAFYPHTKLFGVGVYLKNRPKNIFLFDFKKFKCYVLFEIKLNIYLLIFNSPRQIALGANFVRSKIIWWGKLYLYAKKNLSAEQKASQEKARL